ncbi:MAG TPA: DUF992 domain-containing protein [Beijerinckiaceae bacterium]|jgi:Protein of unknown function (DUF992)|nr:DUF992 domain-containing protein [Beijerinckiaceae bacterium]
MMKFQSAAFVCVAAFAGMITAAPACAQARVGLLHCAVAPGAGMVVTSARALDCTFTPSTPGPVERYVGTVTRYGLDLGVTGPGDIDWGVLAPTAIVGPGALAGVYGGVGAVAAAGIGGGAALLTGGNGLTTSLQPLSVHGQSGANIAGGIEGIQLAYLPPPVGRYYRHHRAHPRHYHRHHG